MLNGVVMDTKEGTPQGGPLSPLLSNIMLNDLDRELEGRGHKFVRYADDCNIYVKTETAGARVMESVKQYLEKKLKLKVNPKKSKVERATRVKFLGFSFFMSIAAPCIPVIAALMGTTKRSVEGVRILILLGHQNLICSRQFPFCGCAGGNYRRG
jgi:hypothetical protein